MQDWEIEAAAQRFALLADPTRLRILHTVVERGEISVGDIAAATGTSRFNASAHLGRLALGGLVERRRQGSTVYYRAGDASVPRICEIVCASLRARRAAAAAV
ncbi:MAG TPA: metalloregulator ArsR/SmtB family transcription factor [Candidatus Dormibacteraeota bacterium]|nr:metalloregulator ArsR/SmtB family transcription factor [Candidatus Dormibacteraeota bacterium]